MRSDIGEVILFSNYKIMLLFYLEIALIKITVDSWWAHKTLHVAKWTEARRLINKSAAKMFLDRLFLVKFEKTNVGWNLWSVALNHVLEPMLYQLSYPDLD